MDKNFSNNLKEIRKSKGLTQKDMAEKIGVAKSTYSLYESGKREPNILTIKKIAKVLDISASELLNIKVNVNENLRLVFLKYQSFEYDKEDLKMIDKLLNKMKKDRIK